MITFTRWRAGAIALACIAMLACATAVRAQAPAGVTPHGQAQTSQTSSPAASIPEKPEPQTKPYEPITGRQRLTWLLVSTLGPQHLAVGVISAGYGTALNNPREDGPHWGGFAERYGIRLTGIATGNAMEIGLGAMWGEDPRYLREPEKSFGARVGSVIEQTFVTRRRDGRFAPAYARFIAEPGGNFLSNTWRANSEADNYHAGIRTLEGFGNQMGSNAWDEFWPTISAHIFHKHSGK